MAPQEHARLFARWLGPTENRWGLSVLDCAEYAKSMTSATGSPEVARKYAELRHATGIELPQLDFKPSKSIPCDLMYGVENRPADGPVFKSRVMEEKWDIYLHGEKLYFCRSWGGDLIYRATVKCEPLRLSILKIDGSQDISEKMTVRVVDFLVKSHLFSAVALHPLPQELANDETKQASYSFSSYGRRGLFGTLEETVGTPYYLTDSW